MSIVQPSPAYNEQLKLKKKKERKRTEDLQRCSTQLSIGWGVDLRDISFWICVRVELVTVRSDERTSVVEV